jgi:guanosine-3',5'-bis(diphosphate) 3'-pyrophosphohydrolase
MESLEKTYRPLLEAVSFAARAHHGQFRKDRQTPYASHPFRVCLILRHIFGIDDPKMLTAAVLHDTIEDTTTDYDDVVKHFGVEVARWVSLLSKDKRMAEEPREDKYMADLGAAPWQVKVCKLGDIFDNLLDSQHTSLQQRERTLNRSHAYLAALDREPMSGEARRAFDLVARLLEEMDTRIA